MSGGTSGSAPPLDAEAACLQEMIYAEVRRCCLGAHHGLRSIVATGSLARGEATFLRDGAGWALAGDAEFLLIFADGAEVPIKAAESELAQRVEAALVSRGLWCRIDLSGGPPACLRQLTASIFAYELRECGRVIGGDDTILSLVPTFSSADIPLGDAWRLLTNRLVEQVEVLTEDRTRDGLSPKAGYRVVKLYLDMATSFLVFVGAYAPTYRARADRLNTLARSGWSGEAPIPLERFAEMVDACTRWKIAPSGEMPPMDTVRWADTLRDARRLWRWELGRLTNAHVTVPDDVLLNRWMAQQSLRDRVRGWLYVIRRCGWLRSLRSWPRWAWQAAQGSPRYWVYKASVAVLFGLLEGGNAFSTGKPMAEELGRKLPVRPESDPQSSELARLALAITWNYTEFLVRTRA